MDAEPPAAEDKMLFGVGNGLKSATTKTAAVGSSRGTDVECPAGCHVTQSVHDSATSSRPDVNYNRSGRDWTEAVTI